MPDGQLQQTVRVPVRLFIMDNALEIDAFITSQHGGGATISTCPLPPQTNFQLQDGHFLCLSFFDTLAVPVTGNAASRLSLSATSPLHPPPPPLSTQNEKY